MEKNHSTGSSAPKDELVSLQALRAVAAVMISLHHFAQLVHVHAPTNPVTWLLLERGPLFLDFFFVLSGFVIAITAERHVGRTWQFLVNRGVRIFPNYWFYTTLLVVSVALMPPWSYLTSWTPRSLALSFFLVPHQNPNGYGLFPFLYTGWSLTYEVFFYGLVAACVAVAGKRGLPASIAILVVLPFVFGSHHPLGPSNRILLELAAGVVLQQTIPSWTRLPAAWKIVLFGSCAVATGILLARGVFHPNLRLFVGAWGLAAAVSAEGFFRIRPRLSAVARWLGEMTYSVYLSHVVVLGWIVAAFGVPGTPWREAAVGAVYLCANLLVARTTFKLVETGRFPSMLKSILLRKGVGIRR
jgi:peptidoglycan/LPS O-acetylase OafA/YrhL